MKIEQLNRVELRGKVGNVRLNSMEDAQVANFSLATNYVYKQKDGTPVIETTWHNVVLWSGRERRDLSFIKKGVSLHVNGRIRLSHYLANDGTERSIYEIFASSVEPVEDQLSAECSI